LRKAFDAVHEIAPAAPRSVFSDDAAIVRFGVGKNMVTSIRHWGLACGLIDEQTDGYVPTAVANRLFGPDGWDLYCEQPATAWFVHWQLAGRAARSTTWWWLFNMVVQQRFDAVWLKDNIKEYALSVGHRASDTTLGRDIEVCLRSYVPRLNAESYEDVAEPLLGELGLLQQVGKGVFEFRRGAKHTLPDALFAYALVEFWQRHARDASTLSFDAIVHEPGSPGRVFKLDENAVADKVLKLDSLTRGHLQWSDTAGLRQVVGRWNQVDKLKLLGAAYD
jgi:hypothetical protein